MPHKKLTKRERENIFNEVFAISRELPDWNITDLAVLSFFSGEVPLRLEKPKPESFGYNEFKLNTDKNKKKQLKQKLKAMPITAAILFALMSASSYFIASVNNYFIVIIIAAFFFGLMLGSYLEDFLWKRENNTTFLNLNNYEKALFEYVYTNRRRKTSFWTSLSGIAFEQELAKLFRLAGFSAELTSSSGDKGVDIKLQRNGSVGIVQCKAHKKQIGPSVVRELNGTAKYFNSDFAILASVSGFTKGSIDFADEEGIILMNLEDIIKMQDSIAKDGTYSFLF